MIADFKQDVAGVGGDTNFIRSTVDARFYSEWIPDIINVIRLQAGHIDGWGDKDVRMLDHFKMGPNLVRGFATAGIGPRDITPGYTGDALGGTMYWGASLEFQIPLYFIPKDVGLKGAVFADAGSIWDYKGPTFNPATGETMIFAGHQQSAVVGRRRPGLGFAVRTDAVRLFLPDHQGRIRQGAAIPFRRRHQILITAAGRSVIVLA